MLVLSRRTGERICIGSNVVITTLEVRGNHVRIGIEAPDNVCILRGELRDALVRGSAEAVHGCRAPVLA